MNYSLLLNNLSTYFYSGLYEISNLTFIAYLLKNDTIIVLLQLYHELIKFNENVIFFMTSSMSFPVLYLI